jgi:HK97 gp10 family phage protein
MSNIGGVKIEWFDKAVLKKAKDLLHAVSRDGANMIAQSARSKAPWDTGDLATDIRVEKSKFEDGGFYVIAHGPKHIGKYYASFVELGTHKDTAQPFLRPAAKGNKAKIIKKWKDAVDKL